ncbi:hypothetical protein [Streptomyces roseochromogenus]|uniref:DUF4386 domain-containing protein n=1 Tax=Streptomyces roseochromogenus subsp. oscitans DS 12.976 TaxID=1352936 RepID=V6KX76_STRRC|nr:hypothetical protein [Streptomyces roseochromogenus]EST36623.1 hypothetical protein M878_01675 [Streptomyces roseochromogenus subsp. oscitans DS 12.976]
MSGIVFAVVLAATLVLVHSAIPGGPGHGTAWLDRAGSRDAARAALAVLPFAGIAFLWFMGAVRSHFGEAEDKFFATVLLGSGLLFAAALFGLAATAGGLLAASGSPRAGAALRVWENGRDSSFTLLSSYGMRMAAVFTACVSTIGRRLGAFPPWLAWLGYLIAVILLFVAPSSAWFELAFPLWVLLVSIHMLATAGGRQRTPRAGGVS